MKAFFTTLIAGLILTCTISQAQSIVSVNPNSANQNQTLTVTITGSGTHFDQGSNTVSFKQGSSTINASFTSGSSTTSLTANISIPLSASLGLYDVLVSNPTDGNMTLAQSFTVNPVPPSILSISPASASQGQQLNVTITGQGTHFDQGSNTIYLFKQGSTTTRINGTFISASSTNLNVSFNIPMTSPVGAYDVNVSNTTDGNLTLAQGFTVVKTAVVKLDPPVAITGQTLTITITGQGLPYSAGNTSVTLTKGSNTLTGTNISVQSSTSLTMKLIVPGGSIYAGLWDVKVNINGTIVTATKAFQVTKPYYGGVNELNNSNELSFFPNPFSENGLLTYSLKESTQIEISIYNVLGEKIKTLLNTVQTTGQYELPIADKDIPTKGIYFISIKSGNNNPEIIKAVKQ